MVPVFFQAEDGIRDVERSRGLGDVYKRQVRQLAIANSIQKQVAGKSKSTIVTTSEFAPLVAQLVTHQDHDLSLIHI